MSELSAIASLALFAAASAPIVGLGWMISMFDRRTSIKELMCHVAYWGVVIAVWIKIAGMITV
jgi:hypothetical protein